MQLLHDGHNIYVFRGNRQTNVTFDKNNPVLRLIGQDGYTAAGTSDVNIQSINCVKAFMIPNFVGQIGSVQGYDIDNGANYIYVSSQYAGNSDRKIVKIPWGSTDSNHWESADLTNVSTLDVSGCYTELEGIQLIDENDLYLTVAYHRSSDALTTMNRIYRVSWTSNI